VAGVALLAACAPACGFDGAATNASAISPGGGVGAGDGDGGPGRDRDALADPDAIVLGPADDLTLTSGPPAAQVDLEQEGKLAWIHWGTTRDDEKSVNQKASAIGVLPAYRVTGSTDIRTYEDNVTTFRWVNGVPLPTQGATRNGVYSKTGKPAFHLDRIVGVAAQRFVIYAGLFKCKARLSVALGTGPTARTAFAVLDSADHGYGRYVIDHRAKDPGTPLVVTWELVEAYDANNSNVTLAAATLAALP
jgi:hypothetical protein